MTARRRPHGPGTRTAQRDEVFAPDDIRRTIAAAASAVVPGLGQLLNGRMRLARWFAIPVLALAAVVLLRLATTSPTRLFASIISPSIMGILLALNLVLLGWRLVAVLHAYFDGRYGGRPGRAGAAGLALVLVAVVAPHAVANAWGSSAQAAFARVFAGEVGSGFGSTVANAPRGPGSGERVNILVVGIDKTPWRTATLTDSLMVVSIDPVGETVSMVSLPRDLVQVPLGNGNLFGPKINSLMSYADRHPKDFPQGGMRALEDAVGALLGIRIHYYARIDFFGFVKIVDAVGGIDVDVRKAFFDDQYDGIGVNQKGVKGWGVKVGLHHFNGWQAIAYSRARKADGESDFTRAARQQEVLLALRDKLMADGSLLMNLPSLLDEFGGLVMTDIPTDRLPELAAIADDMQQGAVYRTVLKKPLIKTGGIDKVYGSIQVADLDAILAVSKMLFPAPGQTPIAWPQPSTAPGSAPAPSGATTSP